MTIVYSQNDDPSSQCLVEITSPIKYEKNLIWYLFLRLHLTKIHVCGHSYKVVEALSKWLCYNNADSYTLIQIK